MARERMGQCRKCKRVFTAKSSGPVPKVCYDLVCRPPRHTNGGRSSGRVQKRPKPEPELPRESEDKSRLGNPLTSEVEYTDDETEFALAMDRYKRERKRPFPAWSEVLAVLRSLGYRKVQ